MFRETVQLDRASGMAFIISTNHWRIYGRQDMIKIYHCNILQTTSLQAIAEDLLELRDVFNVHERVMFPRHVNI